MKSWGALSPVYAAGDPIDAITPASPSWSLKLNGFVGLKKGQGPLFYNEAFVKVGLVEFWRCLLRWGRKTRPRYSTRKIQIFSPHSSVDIITPRSPSWSFNFNGFLGLKLGQGSLRYSERYTRLTGSWYTILSYRRKHNTGFQTSKRIRVGVDDSGRIRRFLYMCSRGDWTSLKGPLNGGICLFCGGVDPFVLEYDHPLGYKHDPNFVITLCANCHHLKTGKRFWLLEKRMVKWLG